MSLAAAFANKLAFFRLTHTHTHTCYLSIYKLKLGIEVSEQFMVRISQGVDSLTFLYHGPIRGNSTLC